METTIPFQGFYESEYSELIDYTIEEYFQNDHGYVNPAITERLFNDIDYKSAHAWAAEIYTEKLADEAKLDIKFKELVSPRYYNFETDRIFCDIELSEVERVYEAVDKEELAELVKRYFTSYDGFISHYNSKLEAWGTDLSEWDHNQVGVLLEAYIVQETETGSRFYDCCELRERLSNNLYNFINNFARYDKLSKYLSARSARHNTI